MTINITNFKTNKGVYNILEIDKLDIVLKAIDNRTTGQKIIDELFNCLSQSLSAADAPFKDKCATVFANKVYSLLPQYSAEITQTLNEPPYKGSVQLAKSPKKFTTF